MKTGDSYEIKMENFYKLIHDMLVDHGLWPEEATEIMGRVARVTPNMENRWKDPPDGYPVAVFRTLWIIARIEALRWIDETKPMHWARGMFMEGDPT